MEKPLLSVCIPTYNRASSLKRCLDIIYGQLVEESCRGIVDVVISDNASTDETESLVRKYAVMHGNLSYYKNEANLGFDRNLDNVLTRAQGKFRWVMSDDDYIIDGAVKIVLEVIKKYHDVSFVGICASDQSVPGDFKIFNNGSECLSEMGIVSGGISRCIFNSSCLPSDRQRFYGNFWIHLSLAIEMMAQGRVIMMKNLFIETETVISRWAENGGAFYSSIYIRKIFKDAIRLGYDKQVIGKIIRQLTVVMPRNVASAKYRGLKVDWPKTKLIFAQFSDQPIMLFTLLLIYLCPRPIIRFMRGE